MFTVGFVFMFIAGIYHFGIDYIDSQDQDFPSSVDTKNLESIFKVFFFAGSLSFLISFFSCFVELVQGIQPFTLNVIIPSFLHGFIVGSYIIHYVLIKAIFSTEYESTFFFYLVIFSLLPPFMFLGTFAAFLSLVGVIASIMFAISSDENRIF